MCSGGCGARPLRLNPAIRKGTMSVRKRKWKTRSGEAREAWIVDYADQAGDRHLETFAKKRTPTLATPR
jgi:hypothetical protein